MRAALILITDMDISYISGLKKFNYRVCAVIVSEGRLLAMRDERSPYYYLPGGRVKLGESAEEAIARELKEELAIDAELVRPLWVCQSYFNEDVDGLDYHELCVYFLADVSETDLPGRGNGFTQEEGSRIHRFEWIPFGRLDSEYLYPLFIKKRIFSLPQSLELITERE